MAAEPRIDVELIEGGNGVFDVSSDGNKVFSKHDAGRFPEEGEILTLLRAGTGDDED